MSQGLPTVLNESFITYANEAKMKYLGVKEETLNTVGAVSEETAKTDGGRCCTKRAGSNVGVGITGLAGPGGETPEKKAGLVYIGVSVNGKTKVSKYQFNGNRQKVRQMAVCRALMMVRHALVEEFFEKDWKKKKIEQIFVRTLVFSMEICYTLDRNQSIEECR